MPYDYEVFFSYKRDVESDQWHHRVMEKLKFWLKQEANRLEIRIFFDTEEIHTGERWRAVISRALKSSQIMVCVWSPLYFQSSWCVSEWKTFAEREQLFHNDLVVPASYTEETYFPPEAKMKQIRDLSNYTSTAARFWDTELAVEFELKCLKPLAKDVARVLRSAPPFNQDFPLVEVADALLPAQPEIKRIADV